MIAIVYCLIECLLFHCPKLFAVVIVFVAVFFLNKLKQIANIEDFFFIIWTIYILFA